MSKTRDFSEPALGCARAPMQNPAHSQNIRPDAASSAAQGGAARGKRALPCGKDCKIAGGGVPRKGGGGVPAGGPLAQGAARTGGLGPLDGR